MKNKQIKKPDSANNFGELHTNRLELEGSKNNRTYLYFNKKSNVNTHFFDRDEYKDLPENLQRTANAIDFGASHIRVAGKIAKQLGIPVRDFLRHVEILRGKYNIPIIGANHKPQGFFIATFAEEGESYLKQQKAREEHGAKARHGVERGLTNGFLNKVNQWRHNHA